MRAARLLRRYNAACFVSALVLPTALHFLIAHCLSVPSSSPTLPSCTGSPTPLDASGVSIAALPSLLAIACSLRLPPRQPAGPPAPTSDPPPPSSPTSSVVVYLWDPLSRPVALTPPSAPPSGPLLPCFVPCRPSGTLRAEVSRVARPFAPAGLCTLRRTQPTPSTLGQHAAAAIAERNSLTALRNAARRGGGGGADKRTVPVMLWLCPAAVPPPPASVHAGAGPRMEATALLLGEGGAEEAGGGALLEVLAVGRVESTVWAVLPGLSIWMARYMNPYQCTGGMRRASHARTRDIIKGFRLVRLQALGLVAWPVVNRTSCPPMVLRRYLPARPTGWPLIHLCARAAPQPPPQLSPPSPPPLPPLAHLAPPPVPRPPRAVRAHPHLRRSPARRLPRHARTTAAPR